jgi:hypothetical protein
MTSSRQRTKRWSGRGTLAATGIAVAGLISDPTKSGVPAAKSLGGTNPSIQESRFVGAGPGRLVPATAELHRITLTGAALSQPRAVE